MKNLNIISCILTVLILTAISAELKADNESDQLAATVLKEYKLNEQLQHIQLDRSYDIVIIDKEENMLFKGNCDQKSTLKMMHQSNFLVEIEGIRYFQIKKDAPPQKVKAEARKY